MPSTRSRGELILSPYQELECTLHKMNQNLGILDDDHYPEISPPVDAHDQLLPENYKENGIRRQTHTPRPQEYYKDMIILLTLMGHFSCHLYHKVNLSL